MPPTSALIKIKCRDGKAIAIHSDSVAKALRAAGEVSIRRASHVEPTADSQKWEADMSPIGGPMLTGFATRAAALAAERKWLNANILK